MESTVIEQLPTDVAIRAVLALKPTLAVHLSRAGSQNAPAKEDRELVEIIGRAGKTSPLAEFVYNQCLVGEPTEVLGFVCRGILKLLLDWPATSDDVTEAIELSKRQLRSDSVPAVLAIGAIVVLVARCMPEEIEHRTTNSADSTGIKICKNWKVRFGRSGLSSLWELLESIRTVIGGRADRRTTASSLPFERTEPEQSDHNPPRDLALARPDQNFKLDGKEYNYKAAETHRIPTDLDGVILTRCPLSPVQTAAEEKVADVHVRAKRFKVGLSFPGEHRDWVAKLSEALAGLLTKEKVFYDRFHEAELARPNLDTYLQHIYHDDCELVVVVLCREYEEKEWCGLEFRSIRDLIRQRRDDKVMFVKIADGDVKGVFGIDGYVDAQDRPAIQVAQLICARLNLVQTA